MITIVVSIIATMFYCLFGMLTAVCYLMFTENPMLRKLILLFVLWPIALPYMVYIITNDETL